MDRFLPLQCVFGTNPLSFAAPSTGDPFVLDMATSTAAVGKVCNNMSTTEECVYSIFLLVYTVYSCLQVEIQARKELPIPSAWGVDKEGKVGHIYVSHCTA